MTTYNFYDEDIFSETDYELHLKLSSFEDIMLSFNTLEIFLKRVINIIENPLFLSDDIEPVYAITRRTFDKIRKFNRNEYDDADNKNPLFIQLKSFFDLQRMCDNEGSDYNTAVALLKKFEKFVNDGNHFMLRQNLKNFYDELKRDLLDYKIPKSLYSAKEKKRL